MRITKDAVIYVRHSQSLCAMFKYRPPSGNQNHVCSSNVRVYSTRQKVCMWPERVFVRAGMRDERMWKRKQQSIRDACFVSPFSALVFHSYFFELIVSIHTSLLFSKPNKTALFIKTCLVCFSPSRRQYPVMLILLTVKHQIQFIQFPCNLTAPEKNLNSH